MPVTVAVKERQERPSQLPGMSVESFAAACRRAASRSWYSVLNQLSAFLRSGSFCGVTPWIAGVSSMMYSRLR